MDEDPTGRIGAVVALAELDADDMRAILRHLDEAVADGIDSAVVLAEHIRREKAKAWAAGTGDQAAGSADVNPYLRDPR